MLKCFYFWLNSLDKKFEDLIKGAVSRNKEIKKMLLDIEESTSRSQYTRAKSMLEEILIRKKIILKPKEKIIYQAAVAPR